MNKTRKRRLDDDQATISALEAGGYEPISNEAEEIERITQIFKENGTTERDVEKRRSPSLRTK